MQSTPSWSRIGSSCASSALLALALGGCAEYDAPPNVELVPPPTGTFYVGDPIRLSFSQPIDGSTLAVRIWPDERNIEYELIAETPALDRCTPGGSECGSNGLELDDDRLGATLWLDSETLGRPDVPQILEVMPGLVGDNGARVNRALQFDFQFKPLEVDAEPVAFQAGGYTIVAILEEPLPAIINLIADMERGPGNQVAALACEGDPLPGMPENTGVPEELEVDRTEQGYVIFAYATLREAEDGTRFYESDPFDINLTFGPIRALVAGTRLTGKITEDDDGHDRIDGTMSFDSLSIDVGGSAQYDYPPGTTTFVAQWVEDERMPEGAPRICGDQCGAVTTQCFPDPAFPGAGYCGTPVEGSGDLPSP